jgi:hypothetical protein
MKEMKEELKFMLANGTLTAQTIDMVFEEYSLSDLPEDWENRLDKEFGLHVTVDGWLKGYDTDGEFYYSDDEMKFLIKVFNNLLS